MRRLKFFCLIIILCISFSALSGCSNNSQTAKSEWNEAFKFIYGVRMSTSSGGVYTEYYCLVPEDTYNQVIEEYHYSDDYISWNYKLKKMYVKIEDYTCYVKLISWGGNEEIKTHKRSEIIWIDYIY